jgi:hypothetical protein
MVYNTENYEQFPKEVRDAFGDLDCGFEIARNLEKLGYTIINQDLSGYFETFKKTKISLNVISKIKLGIKYNEKPHEIFENYGEPNNLELKSFILKKYIQLKNQK